MKLQTKKKPGAWYVIISALLVLGLLGYGAYELRKWYMATQNPTPTITTGTITYSTDTPDETKPTQACEDYKVADPLPRTITIESIGVRACIERVGVDQNNQVAVPTNIHTAGWFERSAIPGEAGVSLIDGHVLGRYADAVFAKLGTIEAGAVISVELGDGTVRDFEVFSMKTYSLEEAQGVYLEKADGVSNQLTLITCGGQYNNAANTYDKRVIVQARLVE